MAALQNLQSGMTKPPLDQARDLLAELLQEGRSSQGIRVRQPEHMVLQNALDRSLP
jgi:hypothetical protein